MKIILTIDEMDYDVDYEHIPYEPPQFYDVNLEGHPGNLEMFLINNIKYKGTDITEYMGDLNMRETFEEELEKLNGQS